MSYMFQMGWFVQPPTQSTFFGDELGFFSKFCRVYTSRSLTASFPLKNVGWKTILFFWESVTFQGRTGRLQGNDFLLGKRNCVCTSWICWICFDSVMFVWIRSHGIHHQFSPPFERRCFYFFQPPQANLR